MARKTLLLIFLAGLLLTNCRTEQISADPDDYSYVSFGHFYGECAGEGCVEIFQLKDGKLYEDTNDRYPSSSDFYQGNFVERNNAAYELVKNLPAQIPDKLLQEKGTVIGQPDAGDWGGFYLEIYDKDGRRKFWLIDKMKSNIPSYLHPFVDDLSKAIKDCQ